MDPLPMLPSKRDDPCIRNGCSACCHDTEMLLTEADARRLEAATGSRAGWRLAPDGFLQLRTRPGPAPRPCHYLGADGRCTVYDARPEGCRLYPAVWDGLAVLDTQHCPHTHEFTLVRQADDAVARLARTLISERAARRRGRASAGAAGPSARP